MALKQGERTMTRKTKRKDPTMSRSDAWIEVPYREHPDGAKKYRHPVAGKTHDAEVLDVDAVLSVAVLDRLNRMPDIDIHNVCAGHGVGHGHGVNQVATIGFYTDQDFGLWLIQQPAMPYSKRSSLFFYGSRWSVHLECNVFDKHINHVAWWKLVAATLERLVRRYRRENSLGRRAPTLQTSPPGPTPSASTGHAPYHLSSGRPLGPNDRRISTEDDRKRSSAVETEDTSSKGAKPW
jgi:hypothetical protein